MAITILPEYFANESLFLLTGNAREVHLAMRVIMDPMGRVSWNPEYVQSTVLPHLSAGDINAGMNELLRAGVIREQNIGNQRYAVIPVAYLGITSNPASDAALGILSYLYSVRIQGDRKSEGKGESVIQKRGRKSKFPAAQIDGLVEHFRNRYRALVDSEYQFVTDANDRKAAVWLLSRFPEARIHAMIEWALTDRVEDRKSRWRGWASVVRSLDAVKRNSELFDQGARGAGPSKTKSFEEEFPGFFAGDRSAA